MKLKSNTMKKRHIYILLTFLTLSACQSPDDFLDVEPTGYIIPSTLEDYDKMLQDYAIIRGTGSGVGNNTRFMDPDVYHNQASFNTISNSTPSVNAYTWQHDLFDPAVSDNDYNGLYQYIHVMNYILEEVDDAKPGNFDASKRNILKAEAMAQRAFEYFLTVNEYAHHYDSSSLDLPGVAMPLTVDLQAQLSRSSVGEVYQQVLTDLNEALRLLGNNYQAVNSYANFRPGKASIYALLSEVYLYMGDFDQALGYSNTALSLYDYLEDYNTVDFANPSNPWSGYNNGDNWYYGTLNKEILWNRYIAWGFNNPFQLYAPDLEALYDKDNDRRWYLFATQTSSSGVDVSPNYIYMYASSERCNGLSVPRLMLTNAEAKVRTGDGAGAIDVLNTLLENRLVNFTPLTHTDNTTTLQLVKDERRKELAGSALNLYDQKRYHVYGEVVPTYTRTNPITGETFTLAPGDDGYVVKIAQSVRDQNPNLN
ncbi:RagB/SusD family nutrient uptake outer membrane protein [Zhouia spongiae]|uniref:RagB/SusD family nutrient uptake outer membrane protein n=1 Tax=Zhouia spongiae TaxID=2202721 RepID=A0ABY3YLN6_9FLAO|nr:RagB/SusD family nutrient uptake outer membrane protein [Zhouia spongiae]UNY98561.1 RagB/SusD family nutrient uptake outer membrane protein [Zhouia spongiae]